MRTSLLLETLTAEQAVSAYDNLSQVEWAFRSLKTMDLQVRSIYHWKIDRIRAHVFLCMLAYYVEWYLRGELSELLFHDHEREAAEATRESMSRRRSVPRRRSGMSKIDAQGSAFRCRASNAY